MAAIRSKKINIYWKPGVSSYQLVNKKVLVEEPRRIGSAKSAVNYMLSRGDELKLYMPSILGLSPSSPDWDKSLSTYFNSLSYEVPSGGKEWEIGFSYEFNAQDQLRRANITGIVDFAKENYDIQIKDDETLASFVESKIPEEDKYKFGSPINVEDYIIWRYALKYSHVANDPDDIDKSAKIRFYLFSREQAIKEREEKLNLEIKAMSLYLDVIKDKAKRDALLYVFGSGYDIRGKGENERNSMLKTLFQDSPATFIKYAEDSNLTTKATIERLIYTGILRRLPNTQIIVDSTDASIVIGNNIDDAVAYFSNEANKPRINEYISKYKGLPSK